MYPHVYKSVTIREKSKYEFRDLFISIDIEPKICAFKVTGLESIIHIQFLRLLIFLEEYNSYF
jgi:hypothetical protein